MKKYEITQHPFKITIEFDDEWLAPLGIGEPEMQEIVDEWNKQFKPIAIALHAAVEQQKASEEMKGGDR